MWVVVLELASYYGITGEIRILYTIIYSLLCHQIVRNPDSCCLRTAVPTSKVPNDNATREFWFCPYIILTDTSVKFELSQGRTQE